MNDLILYPNYILYKTINKINGKFYYGIYETLDYDDSYLGSGKGIIRAIEKHGKDNFIRIILYASNSLEIIFHFL